MNDAEFEQQRQRLLVLCERWFEPLGLDSWDVDLAYARDDFEVNGKPEPDTIALTSANWQYIHGTITWNMPQVLRASDADLEICFVHECMHLFLSEARESGDDWWKHEERVASMLGRAFLGVRDHTPVPAAPEPNGAHDRQPDWSRA